MRDEPSMLSLVSAFNYMMKSKQVVRAENPERPQDGSAHGSAAGRRR